MNKIFTSLCLLLCAFFAVSEAYADSTPLAVAEVPDGYYFIKGKSESYGTTPYWTVSNNLMAMTATADASSTWFISKQSTSDGKNVYAIFNIGSSRYIGYGPSVVPNANYTADQTSYYITLDSEKGYYIYGTWNAAAIGPKDGSDKTDNWGRGKNTEMQYVDLIPTANPNALELTTNKPYFLRMADGGQWHVGGYIYATGDDVKMYGQSADLTKATSVWTIEGNTTDGYKFINANGKALGVNVAKIASNEKTAYVALFDAENPGDGISILWDATKSNKIENADGFFLGVHGYANYRMNDNNSVENDESATERGINFWTDGAGIGSTFRLYDTAELSLSTVTTSDEATNGKAFATCYFPFAYTLSDGVTAYTATLDLAAGQANTTAVTGTIPANTGIVAQSDATTATLTLAAGTDESFDKGGLTGTLTDITGISEESSANYLVLGINSQRLGFFLPKIGGNIRANRAYFDISKLSDPNVSGLVLNLNGSATGISTILPATDAASNAATYDLSGRRVTNPAKGGIYIQAGKKIIVK